MLDFNTFKDQQQYIHPTVFTKNGEYSIFFDQSKVLVLNQLPIGSIITQTPRLVTTGITGDDISDALDFFIPENIELHFTCAVTLNGEMFIYGGDHLDTQVK